MEKKRLYIIVPCYNEQEVLNTTAKELEQKLMEMKASGMVAENSRILFVDDGSKDETWSLICALHNSAPNIFSGLKLSRNRGHQNALYAGLMAVQNLADATVSIDADLQDDTNAIAEMVQLFLQGNDIVYGVRSNRNTDSAFKRITAEKFYGFLRCLGVDVVHNHADFRLMSQRAVQALSHFPEEHLYLRGMVQMVGFPSAVVEYTRKQRVAGESKYPLKKMLALAWDGVTSFSIKPIRFITLLGGGMLAVGVLLVLYSLVFHKWSTLFITHWFLAGLQILSTGIVGEYVGKIYMETKKRPRYIIEQFQDK